MLREVVGAPVELGVVDGVIDDPVIDMSGPRGGRITADRERALLHSPAAGKFLIERGGLVVAEPSEGVTDEDVDALLHGTITAFLLGQRGEFALHANLVEVGGRAVALAGDPGMGKTTTSMLLAARGHRILGDDVLPLLVAGEGVEHRTTGRPLRIETPDATVKRRVPQAATPAGPLHAVVALGLGGAGGVEVRRLEGADAVGAVRANGYRRRLIERVWPGEQFRWASSVAAAVPVYELRRPADRWTGDAVAAEVEAIAAARG